MHMECHKLQRCNGLLTRLHDSTLHVFGLRLHALLMNGRCVMADGDATQKACGGFTTHNNQMYPPVLYPLFARVHSNFAEKVAFLHFLTRALCTFNTGKSAKSDTIVQKKSVKCVDFARNLTLR